MSQFENVTVVKAANVYFDGNVTSRTVVFADGSKKSLGLALPGEYEFGTDEKELMEIIAGSVEVLLLGASEWVSVNGGESFEVPAASSFKIKVHSVCDYCCSYLT